MIGAKTLSAGIAIILIGFVSAEYDVAKYCQLVTPGTKLPSLSSCPTYYICQANAKPIQVNCTGATAFSKDAQNCVPESSIVCYYGLTNPCQFKDKEFAPSNEACNMWHYCEKGKIAGTGSCQFGQIFYALNNTCINGDCINNADKNSEVKNVCEIMPDGQFFGDFKDCKAWRKCNTLSVKSGICRNDLVFDTNTNMCLENDGKMCGRTNNIVINQAGGPPAKACTSPDQIVGDAKLCSVYYTCEASASQTPNIVYEWVQKSCDNQFFDVISKKCNGISHARPYSGCDRCQFSSGNPYWVNAVDSICSKYLTCNKGQKIGAEGSCGLGNFYNEASQACIEGDYTLPQYAANNGACQNYSCNAERVCSLGDNSSTTTSTSESTTESTTKSTSESSSKASTEVSA